MTGAIRFLPEADEELADAGRWYEGIDSELAIQFARAVDDALEQVVQFPDAGHPISGRWWRVLLQRFPFALIYRAADDEIVVDAVVHLSRLPGYWRDRA